MNRAWICKGCPSPCMVLVWDVDKVDDPKVCLWMNPDNVPVWEVFT